MKKIASFLLCVFILVHSGSAASAIFTDVTSVYVIDENKEVNYKKENDFLTIKTFVFHRSSNKAIHVMERILAAPCLKNWIPPPDYI